MDPAYSDCPDLSPFHFANNNPVIYIDPESMRIYFSAGAAHEPDNTGYIDKMLTAFEVAGIQNTVDI